jgi:hypothetical protein
LSEEVKIILNVLGFSLQNLHPRLEIEIKREEKKMLDIFLPNFDLGAFMDTY